MKLRSALLVCVVAAGIPAAVFGAGAPAQAPQTAARPLPTFELEPDWPKIPAKHSAVNPFIDPTELARRAAARAEPDDN